MLMDNNIVVEDCIGYTTVITSVIPVPCWQESADVDDELLKEQGTCRGNSWQGVLLVTISFSTAGHMLNK